MENERNIEDELMKMPESIKAKEIEIWEKTKTVERKQEEIDFAITKLEIDISAEKDVVTGKNVYSNAQSRDNALKLQLAENKELQQKLQDIKSEKNTIKLSEIELSYARNLFSALKKVIDLRSI